MTATVTPLRAIVDTNERGARRLLTALDAVISCAAKDGTNSAVEDVWFSNDDGVFTFSSSNRYLAVRARVWLEGANCPSFETFGVSAQQLKSALPKTTMFKKDGTNSGVSITVQPSDIEIVAAGMVTNVKHSVNTFLDVGGLIDGARADVENPTNARVPDVYVNPDFIIQMHTAFKKLRTLEGEQRPVKMANAITNLKPIYFECNFLDIGVALDGALMPVRKP